MKDSSLEISQYASEIKFTLTVPIEIRQESGWYYSACRAFGVHSQGLSQEEAKEHIIEAVQLFIETCYEQGTLEKVLKECGFHPVSVSGTTPSRKLLPTEFMVDVPLPLMVANHAQTQAC